MKKYALLLIFLLTFVSALISAQDRQSNLPTLFITTTNAQPVIDKVNYVPGNIVIKSADLTEQLSMITGIRGRGNSTWGMAKKPYRIKLDKKTNILNLPAKAKSWVLLANYADKTLIRNAVAFKISSILGFEFTPSARFVDLVLNGTYLGNYMLTDQMEAGPGRVNVDLQDSTVITEPNITGGYFLELDGFAADPDTWFTSGKGLKITVHSPDVVNQTQLTYIQNYINSFENTLFSADFADPIKGYRAIVDTTSLINWYIGCELTGNSDSFWSTYIYKKRLDDKLYFGPMWDYDIAFNNDSRLGDATLKLMRQNAFYPRTWIEQMWLDPWFQKAVLRRWQQLTAANLLGVLNTYVDETASLINVSEQLNFRKWNVLSSRVYLEPYLFSTYGEGVDFLKTYLSQRVSFLTSSFSSVVPAKPSEAFVATNNYYRILNKKTNNSIDVTDNSVDPNASLVMWQPAEEDFAQLWVIKQISTDLYQIVNKNSGLAMAGNGINKNLIQIPVNSTDQAQQWAISPVNTGDIYGVVNKKSGYSINNYNSSFANGTAIVEFASNITGSESQQWYFQKAEVLLTDVLQPEFLEQKIDMYPNPAIDKVSIRLTMNEPKDITITVYNLQGIQLYQTNNILSSGNQVITIPLVGFDSGMYLVNISNEQGEKIVRKLLVTSRQ
ncbi:CotH kinase family protein [Flavobacterium sp. UBA6031]|uniref:CotH kinase family protein n=1 Tax=Flavobacterium sp. UBA6031 TaxID=1946551 RepID=UPI0025C47DCD|nr:CotH kinase family protein [Flavobacterium sp. UBA6031]